MSCLTEQRRAELDRLIDRMCDQIATADEVARLGRWIVEDPATREHYVACLETHARLAWQMAPGKPFLAEELVFYSAADEGSGFRDQGSGASIHPSSFIPHPSPIPPIVVDPAPDAQMLPGSFLFSYSVAIVLFVMALLAGFAWRISLPSSEGPAPYIGSFVDAQKVGHITALADCKWSKQGSGIRGQGSGISKTKDQSPKTVYLGDRLAVASGLMEIAYDTGAKVILQGPCTYEIDSDRGGYLAVGKLTARVEKRAEGGRRRAEDAIHYQLPTTNYQLFSVRTPTAIVTDLGTEFGVEVESSGATRSHVFQGSVEVRSSNSRRLTTSGESVEILHAGESARVERGRNRAVVITREPGQPSRFVRRIGEGERGEGRGERVANHQSSNPQSLIPNPFFRLTDLGTLGGKMSRAHAINAAGHVVGEAATVRGATHAFLYVDGKMRDLASQGGDSCAFGINSHGQVVGRSGLGPDECRAFAYREGVMKGLGALGGNKACAQDINDAGTIVGYAENSNGVQRAFLLVSGRRMKDLGAFGGPKTMSRAYGINAAGQVVGYAEHGNGLPHAFLYTPGLGMKDLGALGGSRSWACRVNDRGQVIGRSAIAADAALRAFVFSTDSGMSSLGILGGRNSMAVDVNGAGQVVGMTDGIGRNATRSCAFLYSDGKMFDLNALVDATVGWSLDVASAINDSGQIAGYGTAPNGTTRAFLLTPQEGARD